MVVTLSTVAETRWAASCLNGLCTRGAGGTARLELNVRHDYPAQGQRAGRGQGQGKGGRGARRAGHPSA